MTDKADRIITGIGAGATLLGTALQLRFKLDEVDRLDKVTLWGFPVYSRARAEARAKKKQQPNAPAVRLTCEECEHFGGRT